MLERKSRFLSLLALAGVLACNKNASGLSVAEAEKQLADEAPESVDSASVSSTRAAVAETPTSTPTLSLTVPAAMRANEPFEVMWGEVAGAVAFEFRVGRDESCADIIVSIRTPVAQRSQTITLGNGSYFICVRAISDAAQLGVEITSARKAITVGATGGAGTGGFDSGSNSGNEEDGEGDDDAPPADTIQPTAPTALALSSPALSPGTDASPTILVSGAVVGDVVSLYSDATCSIPSLKSSVEVTANPAAITSNDLVDGTYTLYAAFADAAGNKSTCSVASATYVVDTTAPAPPSGWFLASPAVGASSTDATAEISGSSLAAENGGTVRVYSDNSCASEIGSATISAGAFTVTNISLATDGSADGVRIFYGRIFDVLNQGSAGCTSLGLSYTLDTTPPSAPTALALSSPASSPGTDVSPTILVSGAVVGDVLSLFADATCSIPSLKGSAAVTADPAAITSNDLADGTITLYAAFADAADNKSTCSVASVTYVVDTTDPAAPTGWSLASPAAGASSTDATPEISGSGLAAENGGTVRVYSDNTCASLVGSATISGGSFTVANVSLASDGSVDGVRSFYGRIFDVLNQGSAGCTGLGLSYTLDTQVPTITYAVAVPSPTNDATPTIAGSCADSASGVAASGIKICIKSSAACASYPSVDFAESTSCAAGSYSFTPPSALSSSSYDIAVVAVDAAGLVSTTVGQGAPNFLVDAVVPTVSISSQPAQPTAATSAAFVFSGADTGGSGLSGYLCNLDGAGYAACTSTKTYTGVSVGSHTFSLKAVDVAGSASTVASVTWTVSAPADQTDDDNSASGFGGGTHANTEWETASSWLDLTAAGLTAGTGTFTSRVMDAYDSSLTWTSLAFTPARPTNKALPANGTSESAYAAGNAVMTGNILLLHLNESSWNGTANEAVDASGQANHGVAVGLATVSTSGRFAGAGSLSDARSAVSVADANSLDFTTEMSFEMWVRPSSAISTATDARQGLFDKGVFSAHFDGTDGKFRFSVADDTSPSWSLSSDTSSPQTRILATYRGRLYSGHVNWGGGPADLRVCNPGADGVCDNGDWAASYDGPAHSGLTMAAVFNGRLYIALAGGAPGAVVYVCEPGADNQCDTTDWTQAFDGAGFESFALYAFRGHLYAGDSKIGGTHTTLMVCAPGVDGICQTDEWSTSFPSTAANYVQPIQEYNGRLYIGLGDDGSARADVYQCDPGADDVCSTGEWTLSLDTGVLYVTDLAVYNGRLYASFFGGANGDGDIYVCNPGADNVCGTDEWTVAMNGSYRSVWAMATYNGNLYAGQGHDEFGSVAAGDVFVCSPGADGVCATGEWTTSHDGARTAIVAMETYNGRLYAGEGGSGAGDGDIRVFGNTRSVASTTTSWAASTWYHLAGTYDGVNMRLYVNGVEQASLAAAFTIGTNAYELLIGRDKGDSGKVAAIGGFAGLVDEVAFYNRDLSATEVLDRYLRGALRLKFQVRSCDDAVCSGESWLGPDASASTYYSEAQNATLGLPSLTLQSVPNNRFFQYKAIFETDNTSYSPALSRAAIGPSR